jgi:CRISPR/Cas system CSM-associated protein Csm3 (group 7 of RAMP superfamily)
VAPPWQAPEDALPVPEKGGPFSVAEFSLLLHFEGPVLVKAPIPPIPGAPGGDAARPETYAAAGLQEADHVFISTGESGRYYLPGSSLRGVLRAQAARICLARGRDTEAVLFGVVKKDRAACGKGRIEIEDAVLESGDVVYLDHVAIDRITAAAADGKKFSTCGLMSPIFRTTVRVRFRRGEGALLALWGFLLRDLAQGRLWAGSGTARGYGYIRGAEIVGVNLNLIEEWRARIGADFRGTIGERPGRVVLNSRIKSEFGEWIWLWQSVESQWKEGA